MPSLRDQRCYCNTIHNVYTLQPLTSVFCTIYPIIETLIHICLGDNRTGYQRIPGLRGNAEGWCNGLIKDFKLRLEKSRMLLCGENHRIHRTTPFLMTQAWSKPLEHYIPTNMPLPDQPLLISGWCSQPHVKRDDRFYLHMRNDEESRLLMRAESLFLVRYWHATCESIRLCSLLSDLSVVWLSWLKELWWQGKIQYEGESVFFSVCTFT